MNKGIPMSQETKVKLSLIFKGKTSHNIGKKYPYKPRPNSNVPRGEKHYRWKGGISSISSLLKANSLWKIWRETVFLRDNFTCQNPNCKFCNNKIGVKLHPHHIKPVSKFPKLAFKVDNGITYCENYHLKSGIHKRLEVYA